jgi:hypothetical protein
LAKNLDFCLALFFQHLDTIRQNDVEPRKERSFASSDDSVFPLCRGEQDGDDQDKQQRQRGGIREGRGGPQVPLARYAILSHDTKDISGKNLKKFESFYTGLQCLLVILHTMISGSYSSYSCWNTNFRHFKAFKFNC